MLWAICCADKTDTAALRDQHMRPSRIPRSTALCSRDRRRAANRDDGATGAVVCSSSTWEARAEAEKDGPIYAAGRGMARSI